jgi:LysR family transcriptional regulator, benzoate and cis,cis-muconate-responsive activator of ben and cat genes
VVEVRLGCAPDIPLQRLQALLGLLYERCADLDVELTYLPSAVQLQLLREGRLHLGLLHETDPGANVKTEYVYRGELLAAVVPFGHPVAAQQTARLEDLAGDVLLVAPRRAEPRLHSRVVALATSDGSPFRDIREAPGHDIRDLLFAVASGRGVAVAPPSTLRVVGELGEAVLARPLEPAAWMPDTSLAWSANGRSELSPVFAAACEVARELYRP